MASIVIGSGLAGLATAVESRLLNNKSPVILIEDGRASNTAVAGQRYRTRMGHGRELNDLLGWYDGRTSFPKRVTDFYVLGCQQVNFWTSLDQSVLSSFGLKPLRIHDETAWFGPQLGEVTKQGSGQGSSVISWFRTLAIGLGVEIIRGSVQTLELTGETAREVIIELPNRSFVSLRGSKVVLAGGSPSGSLFLSTNVPNEHSLLPRLFEQGVPIADSDVFMMHIAGRCSESGIPKPGCYETDLLSECDALLYDSEGKEWKLDPVITQYLREHRAHEHMPEICARVLNVSGAIRYVSPKQSTFARVSHHYSHLRLLTNDGVRVSGFRNLYAAGDMAGVGHWLGRQPRLPGTALLACLVSGHLAASALAHGDNDDVYRTSAGNPPSQEVNQAERARLRVINTDGLFGYIAQDPRRVERWVELFRNQTKPLDAWAKLSLEIARTCFESHTGRHSR